jgi:hypothetical protein
MDGKTYEKIKSACLKFVEKGGHIIQSDWAVSRDDETRKWVANRTNCACALGALLVVEQPEVDSYEPDDAAAEALDVPLKYIDAFVMGFDGYSNPAATVEGTVWWNSGRQLARELGLG